MIYRNSGQGSPEPFAVAGPKDLYQVVLATSPAFPLKDDPFAGEFAGHYGCRMVVVSAFDPPVPIRQLRSDPILREWRALKAGFVKAALELPDEVWQRLLQINRDETVVPPSRRWQQKPGVPRSVKDAHLEQRLEAWLELNPAALEPLGYRLKVRGRQVWCHSDHDGTIDLLCERLDHRNSFVVVELKAGELRRDAIAQTLGYIGWLREQSEVQEVTGLIIGTGEHIQVPWVLKTVDGQVNTASWADLALPSELRAELSGR